MATKAERRQREAYQKRMEEGERILANPNQTQLQALEEYITWQVLYINDAACNACKFLGDELKTVSYRGNGAKKYYAAAMKRVNDYFSKVASVGLDMEYLSDMFSEMDGYVDSPVDRLREAIADVFKENNVEKAHWIASVETARLLTDYAVHISRQYLQRVQKISKKCDAIWHFNLCDLNKVMEEFFCFVAETSSLRDNPIDLNKQEKVIQAFKRFCKEYKDPSNFTNAANSTNEAYGEPAQFVIGNS